MLNAVYQQSAILCSLHVENLEDNLLVNISTILQDDTTSFVRQAGPELYLGCLEGLSVLTEK